MSVDPPEGVLRPELWTERPVEETLRVYTDWATRYEAEVSARRYRTPDRLAEALAPLLAGDDRPVLDFGCGTGLSGLALRAAGVAPLHGTDIAEAMIEEARPKAIYDRLWTEPPGSLDAAPGTYRAVVAAGVVSLGAAPPETMDILIGALAPGDLLAMSFNDPTLAHGGYDARLDGHIAAGTLELAFRAHGPHLDDVAMGSDVIVLRHT